jgi:predicted extracellular nuclease
MRFLLLTLAAAASACGGASSASIGSHELRIHDIQGPGSASPYEGRVVTTTGIVSGDFQENDRDTSRNLGGFFIQSAEPDADPLTSEGLFVFDGARPRLDVAVGDVVSVTGTVTEFYGETQLAATAVSIVGSASPAPVAVELPAASVATNSDGQLIADLEHVEGMLLRFPQQLTIGNLFGLERYGEIALLAGGRWYGYTNRPAPGADGFAADEQAFAASGFALDDGRRGEYEAPVAYLGDGSRVLRVGDTVSGLTGVMRYSRGSGSAGMEIYRLMPVGDVDFETRNPRPPPPRLEGSLRVAAYNAHNLFLTLDEADARCGPDGRGGCRGADTDAELARQLAKHGAALAAIDADIVALSEIENNGGESLRRLVESVNTRSARAYRYIDTGVVGTDAITNGFIYDSHAVMPAGGHAIIDSGVDPRFDSSRSRPSLAQTFRQQDGGGMLTVVANHLKSKGSSCGDEDPDTGDGQANCNLTRTRAAAALADWLATDPTGSGDADFLVLGDFNAYLFEDPLAALRQAGFVNLLHAEDGATPYSYVFSARSGALDHALASASLLEQVTGVAEWHSNADEPAIRDYNLDNGRNPALFDPDSPYRSGDHDPLIVGLELVD